MQISSAVDPTVSLIASTGITIKYDPTNQSSEVQIIVSYSNKSVQSSFFNLTITPSNTQVPSISALPPIDFSFSVDFSSNVVDITPISNGTTVIELQDNKMVQILCETIGYVSLIFISLGFFIPVGRLIIVEALTVVQISFFSILQLKTIPSTFGGMKFLILSSGFNDISKIYEASNLDSSVYTLMGLKKSFLANYNISTLLFLLPFLLGGIGLLVTKIYQLQKQRNIKIDISEAEQTQKQNLRKESDKETGTKSQSSEKPSRLELIRQILNRIFYESTFYGLLICGYLVFVSIFYTIKEEGLLNIILITGMIVVWILYPVLFLMKGDSSDIDLKKHSAGKESLSFYLRNSSFLVGYGQFKQVHQQISRVRAGQSNHTHKLYLVYVIERILVSALIVSVSPQFTFTSSIIILIYAILLTLLNISHHHYQKQLPAQKVKSVFSYLHNNYNLRQSLNFVFVILIQCMFLIFQILRNTEGQENTIKTSTITTKILPLLILSLLTMSILTNLLFLIWQIKNAELILKIKVIIEIIFGMKFEKPLQSEKDHACTSGKQYEKISQLEKSIKEQDSEIKEALSGYIQNSVIFKGKKSPFQGLAEKQPSNKIATPCSISSKDKIFQEQEFKTVIEVDQRKIAAQKNNFSFKTKQVRALYDEI